MKNRNHAIIYTVAKKTNQPNKQKNHSIKFKIDYSSSSIVIFVIIIIVVVSSSSAAAAASPSLC